MAVKSELMFGFNALGKQKTLDEPNTVAQLLLDLFLMRPGQLPSLPHIGMDLRQYLYKFEEDISIDQIRSNIMDQCSALSTYLDIRNIMVFILPYKTESILYIMIPTMFESDTGETKTITYGFKRNKSSNSVTFNYKIVDEQKI